MNAQQQQQAPQQRTANERILNSKLEEAIRLYGDLTLQKENIEEQLTQTRIYIRSVHGLAPVGAQIEEEALRASPPAGAANDAPMPRPQAAGPKLVQGRKRGRKTNAERAQRAAAEAAAAEAKLLRPEVAAAG